VQTGHLGQFIAFEPVFSDTLEYYNQLETPIGRERKIYAVESSEILESNLLDAFIGSFVNKLQIEMKKY
jgi:hypothetical protein